ncbi:DUF805 domain-containing protein [Salinispora cortesiana]|uniref:DUF805 domain-containing protein n=1 Tax=Salinispora cortesiana TaxID=1305843 RepID=UPI00041ADED5
MSFGDAIRSALTQYVGFSGRARRSEYWWFYLFTVILGFAGGILNGVLETSFVSVIVGLALLLPSLAVGVRRLHDTGRSGWFLLLGLIPFIGFVVLLVFFVQDSKPGPNRFGPNPKDPAIPGLVA